MKPEKVDIPLHRLVRGFTANNEGAGIMYAKEEQIHIEKDVFKSFTNFSNLYNAANAHNNNGLMVIHFRIATSGEENQQNCHPFKINDKWALAHNGIFSGMSQRGDRFSDTAYFAQFLRHLPEDFMDDKALYLLVEDFVKKETSKVVFLSNKGKLVIINESMGSWEDGCWYSSRGMSCTRVDRGFVEDFEKDSIDIYGKEKIWLFCDICNIPQKSIQLSTYYYVDSKSIKVCDSCQEYVLKTALLCPYCNSPLDIDHFCGYCEKIYSDSELMGDFLRGGNYNFRGFP